MVSNETSMLDIAIFIAVCRLHARRNRPVPIESPGQTSRARRGRSHPLLGHRHRRWPDLPVARSQVAERRDSGQRAGRRQPDRLELHHLRQPIVVAVVVEHGCSQLLRGGGHEVVDDRQALGAG